MKRSLGIRGGEEGDQVESINMANVLMLLSRDDRSCTDDDQYPGSPRVFECKTCNRKFTSFQALGGHRASHKKQLRAEEVNGQVVEGKVKVHECSVCGLEFAIGQALGGHMRRHRAAVAAGEKKSSGKRVLYFDLNLPPLEEEKDVDQWRNPVDKVQMVSVEDKMPEDFPEWKETMDSWGGKMISPTEDVAEMPAIGFGLPRDAFT